jgi:hypothetical protein
MSRRYKQQGYQDDDGGRTRRSGGEAPRRERPEGPRGRGLGAPTQSSFRCARCGEPVRRGAEPLPLDATCSKCRSDLHTCTNCRHFDTSARFECRLEIPERLFKKSTRNACELFEPKLVQGFRADSGKPDDPRAAFDALFDL